MESCLDLYFHGDFDGIASAAIVVRYFHKLYTINLYPVNHGLKRWQEHRFSAHALNFVVDFPFSRALYEVPRWVWIDHHRTNEVPKGSGAILYDPNATSCAELVYEAFPCRGLEELVRWAQVVDGALYESPRQALLPEEPALVINAAIASGNNEFRCELVKRLAFQSLEEVASWSEVRKRADFTIRRNVRAIEWIKYNAKFYGNGVLFADFVRAGTSSRYAPFFVFPHIKYCLNWRRIEKDTFELSITVNPWNPPKLNFDLSQIAKLLGGGGHEKACGVVLPNTRETYELIDVVGSFLQKLVEKEVSYGTDHNPTN